MAIKLYFAPATRSTRPRWLLEELGVPYEIVVVDMKNKGHKHPDYIEKVHPHGSVPAAEINGRTIIESGAIVATIADLHLDKGFAPKTDSPDRAPYFQWLFYAQATVEPAIVSMIDATKEGSTMADDKKADARKRWDEIMTVLQKNLDKKDWMMGQRFQAVDCVMGSLMIWANSLKLLEGYPAVAAYTDRCKARPAYLKARKEP